MAWTKKQGESGKEQNDWQWAGGGSPTTPSPGVVTTRPPVAKPKPLPALPPQMGPRMGSPGPTPLPIDAGTRVPPAALPAVPQIAQSRPYINVAGGATTQEEPALARPYDVQKSAVMSPTAPPPSFDMSAAWGITPPGASNPPAPALTGLQAAAPTPETRVNETLGGANPAAMQEAQKRTSMQDQVQQQDYLAEQAKKGLMTGRY